MKDQTFNDFKDLLEAAINEGAIEKPKSDYAYLVNEALHNLRFNLWLQANKGWAYGDSVHYKELLTKSNFANYLKADKDMQKTFRAEYENKKASWKTESEMEIQKKIDHYNAAPSVVFNHLSHTVNFVCECVKPIYPNISALKYFEYFFKVIDFDKIDSDHSKPEMRKYCNAIYYGLEQLLKRDIDSAISGYLKNISNLSSDKANEIQIKLAATIGNLKIETRKVKDGLSFAQRFDILYKQIQSRDSIDSLDYITLITHFNETVSIDLLTSFEIINQTIKEVMPLLKTENPQIGIAERLNNKMKSNAAKEDELAEKERLMQYTTLIDPNYNYSPTFNDFQQELFVKKQSKTSSEYLDFLRETKKVYGNANSYYKRWGARGTGVDRGDLYTQILDLIEEKLNLAFNTYKLEIAWKLKGENNTNYTSIVFYHIPKVIAEYNLTNTEAMNILLDMQGAFSPDEKEKIIKPIIEYLKQRDFSKEVVLLPIEEKEISITSKPVFKPEIVDTIFNILKDYFQTSEQAQLKEILTTGNNASKPLLFIDSGNKLTDAFKKLKENQFILGCGKQELQNWIAKNFVFKHKNKKKKFTSDYIEKCISRNYYPCKKPILAIEKGEILKAN